MILERNTSFKRQVLLLLLSTEIVSFSVGLERTDEAPKYFKKRFTVMQPMTKKQKQLIEERAAKPRPLQHSPLNPSGPKAVPMFQGPRQYDKKGVESPRGTNSVS